MKKIYYCLLIILISEAILSCSNSISNIEISDINKHRLYQNDEINKGKNYSERFNIVKKLINEYKNLKSNNNSIYIDYYLGRLYSWCVFDKESIDSLWYDSLKSKMRNETLYKNYVDSSFYYLDLSVKNDTTNLYALSKYIDNTINAAQLPLKINGLYKYFDYHKNELNKRVNNIIPFTDQILRSDTSISKELSFLALSNSFNIIELNLSQNIDLNNINNLNLLFKLDEFVNKYNKIKHLFRDRNFINYPNELHKKYKIYIDIAKKEIIKKERIAFYESQEVTKYFINKYANSNEGGYGNSTLFLTDDGNAEITIHTCESDGYFGGGTSVGYIKLIGTFNIIDNNNIAIKLPQSYKYSCNNGYIEQWNKELIINFFISYPGLPEQKPALRIKSGVIGYQTNSDKYGMRAWNDVHYTFF